MTAPSHAHDPNAWRDRFPILAESTYLVNHSLGAMPAAARDKLNSFADQWAQRGVRAWAEGWWSAPIDVGNLVGRIMNAPEGSVAMHQNVSVIQSIIASAIDFSGPRKKVVYTDQNFPTNMYVWEGMRRFGAEIEVVPSDAGGIVPTERLIEAIDEQTRIVPISHVCFRNSYLQDAAAVCARAREVGAWVLLDTYQSLGTVPVDVQALGVDMVCGGSVKWLCGGPGAGYLYVRPGLVEELQPGVTGWAAHADPFAFELGQQRYAGGAWRLLHGSPAVASLYGATAGYETVLEVGVEAIRAWSVADCYSPVERAVLAYTDCLVLENGRVPDAVFEALRAELNDTEILEFTYITCTYAMHATMSRALRLEYDDVDDPIVEVPAPEGASLDVMAAVDSADS